MADNQFGKYELQSRLAAGGMAEIFKARYPVAAGISKSVVIKRILPHYAANKQFIQMFTNEARIVMGLSHGNIAQVFDFGDIEGDWFIAMEYVDGQPLSKVIKRARTVGIQAIPTSFAVLVAIEMLKGLHYAHTRLDESGKPLKIVHRDVSPQNVLISYEGQVKLVDFGIAKAKTAGREETESGAVKGKYSYFSPEQARAKDLDARTDVFAAGIVLYEMLCGQLPFQGRMIDTMSRIVKGQFAPPRTMNPDITPALEQIMLTAMAHERDKRYVSAEAFQTALSSYLYQNAPTFQVSSLGSFVQFLFEPDLVSDGRPVQLQREFLDQVTLWKKQLPAPAPDSSPGETAWGKDPSKSGARKASTGEAGAAYTGEEPPQKPLPKWARYALLTAALGLGVGVVTAGYSLWTQTGSFRLELSSTPVGASIFVDGAPWPKKTPTVLELDASSAHTLELTYAGMRDWSRSVTRRRSEVLSMHAELEPIVMNEQRVKMSEMFDAGVSEPVDHGPPMMATFPQLLFKVDAAAHAVNIPASRAARIKVNPARTYKLWTEGKASLGGMASPIWVSDVGYFAQGPTVSAKDSFGQVGAKGGITIKGATMIYAFLLDHAVDDNSGVVKLKLRDNRGVTETLNVDAAKHALILDPGQRMSYLGFNNLTTYHVRMHENGPGPRTRGEKGGVVTKVLVTQQSGFNVFEGRPMNDDALRVFELGKVNKVRGTGFVWLTFPDDGDTSDNSGSLDVEVIPGANPLGGFKVPLPSDGH